MKTLIDELTRILPPQCVLSDEESLRPYECDGLSAYRQIPGCVVIPDSVEQVQAIMQLCSRAGVPVVARGGGTGLSGGALPLRDCVLLSLARFNRILEFNPQRRTVRVEPGVRNLHVSEVAADYGLFYAPDPSSQIACTIGGNVAENSGGVHCLKYGLTVHNIMGARLVTVDGDVLELGGEALDYPGFDLLALITGSEGMLGIIVEVTLKLLPRPPGEQVLLISFPSIESAGHAVAEIIASGVIPAGLEMMDNACIRAVEEFVQAGYPADAAAILVCELDGVEEEIEVQKTLISDLMRQCQADEIRIARDAEEGRRFWAGRKAAFPAVGRISADYYCMDGTIPKKNLASVLTGIEQLSGEYQLPIVNVFHAGDGNLHPLILYDIGNPGELERVEELGGRILELCVQAGGTITGEHGVGIEKINQMCIQFNDAEREQFHAVKRAFDPDCLLNPGKAVPTLNRCAEFGAMHVHHGQTAFPELERF
ncbi:MAG: FAD-binding protein [Thiotrichales bacterium]|nr:FAD-binding protein [Thiotrichales bacterium]